MASDNALWLVDGNLSRTTRPTPTTNELRRVIPTTDFTNALPVGGGGPAGHLAERLDRRTDLRPGDRHDLRLLAATAVP